MSLYCNDVTLLFLIHVKLGKDYQQMGRKKKAYARSVAKVNVELNDLSEKFSDLNGLTYINTPIFSHFLLLFLVIFCYIFSHYLLCCNWIVSLLY